jgi:hypothetical protein
LANKLQKRGLEKFLLYIMPMPKRIMFYAEIKTPPFEAAARFEIGGILREFQEGKIPGEPSSLCGR